MADYKIKKGDNLTKIAKKYGTTVDALVKANNIKDKNLIITGRTLNIPGKAVTKKAAQKTATKATMDKGPGRSYTKQYMDSKRGPSAQKPKRQTVLQKAGINTTAIATTLIPTGKAIQGVKTLAGAAKYGKVVSRNLNKMQAGYTKGIVSKGELDQAKRLAEAVAKRKEALKNAPRPTGKPKPTAPKPAVKKPAPAKKTTRELPKPKPAAKKAQASDTQKMASEMLNRVGGRKPVRRTLKVGAGGYLAKKFYEAD